MPFTNPDRGRHRQGDTTLLIFMLKAKRRALYDDAYARQERALGKGLQPVSEHLIPVHPVLVRDDEPAVTREVGVKKEPER